MKTELFSVLDAVSLRYHETFGAPTVEYAKRAWKRLVNTPGHDFNLQRTDYVLYHVGTFDQETGTIEPSFIKICSSMELYDSAFEAEIAWVQKLKEQTPKLEAVS